METTRAEFEQMVEDGFVEVVWEGRTFVEVRTESGQRFTVTFED